jgi:hypothetical protein
VGKPGKSILLERQRHRRECNIKLDFGEIRWGGGDWPVEGCCVCGSEPLGYGKSLAVMPRFREGVS